MKQFYVGLPEFREIAFTNGKYEVSNTGLVRNAKTKKCLPISYDRRGYPKVNLWLNNKNVNRTIHRLVATTFIPNPNNLGCVNHKDENKENNTVQNLEWVTLQENNALYKNGGGRFNSRLTIEQIKQLYRRNYFGEKQIELAKEFGVSKTMVSLLCNGKTWTHITNEITERLK
jgi:DNA-binding XRE family transcriptional regulator